MEAVISKREEYYTLIKNKRIPDVSSECYYISYSEKLKIIEMLLEKYSSIKDRTNINKALYYYEEKYIKIGKRTKGFTGKILIGLCAKFKKGDV